MKKHVFAICDTDECYANRLAEYLLTRRELPFEIRTYTKAAKLTAFLREHTADIVLVSEDTVTEELKAIVDGILILLCVSGKARETSLYCVDKFQSADKILRDIMAYCSEKGLFVRSPIKSTETKVKVIGVYSPVKRCLQTPFSLAMAQLLGRKGKVLYINLEAYSGYDRLMGTSLKTDLSDLFYYLKQGRDTFFSRVESMVIQVNGMDLLPPFFSSIDLCRISSEEWVEFLAALVRECPYEYLVLDLCDSIQGLFELLQNCYSIYTITKDDGIAQAKIDQYEKILKMAEYTDILEKTHKQFFPKFFKLPQNIEQLPYSELGEYVKNLLSEDGYGQVYED